jgi:hypothetical protein
LRSKNEKKAVMDDKIRDLCRSNLRENLKNLNRDQLDDALEPVRDEEEHPIEHDANS